MPTDTLTLDELAQRFKAKYPQYASVPNAQVAQAVLARYPQYKSRIGGAAPRSPAVEPKSTRPTDFFSRFNDALSQNMKGMAEMPGQVIEEARRSYLSRHPESMDIPSKLYNVLGASEEAAVNKAAVPMAQGLYGVTPPGIMERLANKEDPAKFAADASMFYMPGGEEGVRGVGDVAARAGEYGLRGRIPGPVEAGPLRGAMTRAKSLMDHVDREAQNVPVDHTLAYQQAKRAEALGKYGYTVPAPIKSFIEMVESRMQGGKEPIPGRPGEFIDRPPTTQPLTYQDMRNFEASMGGRIDWDDPGGKMNAAQKMVREAIGKSTAEALRPYGLDVPYLKSKADFTKAYGAEAKWGPFGYFGGKLAGYGIGSVATGHPLILGYAGGKAGESIAGSMVRSIVNAGERVGERAAEDPRDVGRGAPISPAERLRMATDQVNSLKMRVQRNPGDYNAVSALQKAEGDLETLQKQTWGERYAASPQAVGRQGGGGANYSAEDLAALKKKRGIE